MVNLGTSLVQYKRIEYNLPSSINIYNLWGGLVLVRIDILFCLYFYLVPIVLQGVTERIPTFLFSFVLSLDDD